MIKCSPKRDKSLVGVFKRKFGTISFQRVRARKIVVACEGFLRGRMVMIQKRDKRSSR